MCKRDFAMRAKAATATGRRNAAALWLAVMLLCGLTANVYAQVTANAFRRVLLIRAGDVFGTAFTIEVDGRQYLITARHVVAALQPEDTISYLRNDQWLPVKVKIIRYDDTKDVDIAVLVPPTQLTVTFSLDPTLKGIKFGQDVYLLGFPFGIATSGASNAGFPLPYVAKGVMSAEIHEQGVSRIVVDAMTNHGLSGAPVIYRDLDQQSSWVFRVAGVAVAFKRDATRVLRRLGEVKADEITQEEISKDRVVLQDGHWFRAEDAGESVYLNTGIVIVYNISHALDLIRENPTLLGPKTSDTFQP